MNKMKNKKSKPSAVVAWKMLLLSLPKGIASFVTAVAGLAVSLPLSVFVIGLPLLAETLVLCSHMMSAERWRVERWLQGRSGDETPGAEAKPAKPGWQGWRALLAVLGQTRSYRGALYALLQLPIGIAAFTLAVVLPVTSWAVMLSPLAYQIGSRFFSFELFSDGWVMNGILPAWTGYERSWAAAGLGAVLVLLMPAVLRALGRLYAAWILGLAGPAASPAAPESMESGMASLSVEKLPEPHMHG